MTLRSLWRFLLVDNIIVTLGFEEEKMVNPVKATKRKVSVKETKFELVKKALKKNEIIQQFEDL